MYPITILTLYPDMFPGPLGDSLPRRAMEQGAWSLNLIHLRDYAVGKHGLVDDTPYGGGAGMVMRADVVGEAIEAAQVAQPEAQLVYMSPRGKPLTQAMAESLVQEELAKSNGLIILCGRFEGVDERVLDYYKPLEVSLGDFILFGGEVAAMALCEAIIRQIPGVLGNDETHLEESFHLGEERALLLEYPHYTKPPFWKGLEVPEVLTSGHHGQIKAWRRDQAEFVTRERRPDLWQQFCANKEER